VSEWFCGSGPEIFYEDIIEIAKEHSENEGTIFIGTDSQVEKKECVFSTVICLHGANGQVGGRYFFKKTRFQAYKFPTILERITLEVEKSVQLSLKLYEDCPNANIEIHLDISSADKKEKTSLYADMLIGYAQGVGFECKVKPEAFAASTIADKHSK
tara:strand:- start:300 stop:770 length:471 start_codon:yes stop_codon:yes gene_type:complete